MTSSSEENIRSSSCTSSFVIIWFRLLPSFLQGIAKTSFSSALNPLRFPRFPGDRNVRQLTYFSWLNSSCLTNSCTGTSSALAIAMRASRLGWVVLVTHLDTVAGSLPSLSDSHLLFRSRSARTTLIRFNCKICEKIAKNALKKGLNIDLGIFY